MTDGETTVPRAAPLTRHGPWRRRYRQVVSLIDLAVIAATCAVALALHTAGFGPGRVSIWLGGGVLAAWWIALQGLGSVDEHVLADGTREYQRVVRASITTFALTCTALVFAEATVPRVFLILVFVGGTPALLAGRKAVRSWVVRRREHGALSTSVLVIGGTAAARSIVDHLIRHRSAGLHVTGVWVPDRPSRADDTLSSADGEVPVLDESHDLDHALRTSGASAVIVTDTEHLGHQGLKELAWELHERDVDLMVSPHVIDVATTRVTLQSVGTMSLLHLEEPKFEEAQRWEKAVFDRLFALAAVVALSPVLLATALAVRLGSRGPILYRSERVGLHGEPFQMLKFRSMVDNADDLRDGLASDADGLLFKMREDPRVTRVGKALRRFSLDELPQLFNVLRGDMSIVGPRPPLPAEVEQYDEHAGRRLLVKQGITGLWQVSGRSNLSWEDTLRLDIDYVENWSLLRDLQIIWRTVRAVLRGDGAY